MKKLIHIATVPESLLILKKGQLRFLSNYYEIVAIASDGKCLKMIEKQEGVKTIAVNMNRRFSPIRDLISIYKMYRVFKDENPFIIHSITPKAGFVSMIAGYLASVPNRIHTFTGLIFPSRKGLVRFVLMNIDRLICNLATIVIPEGQGVKNDLERFKVIDKKRSLNIIANGNINGIDLEYYKPNILSPEQKHNLKSHLGIDENDIIFVYIGRIVIEKGIEELISAFVALSEEMRNIKLLLIGSFERNIDPISRKFENIIKSNPNIRSIGFQDDIRPYLEICHILVHPSYREGFPNVVIQAGAMNVPCIVTDINGSNEIIIDGVNGLIIPPKNIQALKSAMRKLAIDNHLRQQMYSVSRQLIEERYDQKLVWSELLRMYNSLT